MEEEQIAEGVSWERVTWAPTPFLRMRIPGLSKTFAMGLTPKNLRDLADWAEGHGEYEKLPLMVAELPEYA